MKTTRTRSRRVLIAIALAPVLANLVVCFVFLMARPPAIEMIEEREAGRRRDVMVIVRSSGEPWMFIAERPLRQWNEWHGGEQTWVKVAEVLNGVPLLVTKKVGERWSDWSSARSIGSFRSDTWVRAWLYLTLSSLQWLTIGAVAARLVERRRAKHGAAPAPAAQLQNDVHQ